VHLGPRGGWHALPLHGPMHWWVRGGGWVMGERCRRRHLGHGGGSSLARTPPWCFLMRPPPVFTCGAVRVQRPPSMDMCPSLLHVSVCVAGSFGGNTA
jgi:hypothetical protein